MPARLPGGGIYSANNKGRKIPSEFVDTKTDSLSLSRLPRKFVRRRSAWDADRATHHDW
jgi:hypothetical protein